MLIKETKMRKLLISVAAISLILAGCADSTNAAAQVAPTGDSFMTNTIAVSGTGQVTGEPDTLIIDLGVQVLRPSVGEATGEAARLAQAVIDALKAQGLPTKTSRPPITRSTPNTTIATTPRRYGAIG